MNAYNIMQSNITAAPAELQKKIKAEVNIDLIKKNAYDKFGDGKYISVETVNRLLNEIFGYVWSWEVVSFVDKGDYVICHGRLSIPGIGVRDGIGSAKADKKDNSTMYSSAASFAFKSAAKRIGIAPNLFDAEDYDLAVFESEVGGNNQEPQDTPPPKPPVELQSEKQTPTNTSAKATELKKAYSITSKTQFVAFAQLWDPTIKEFGDIKPNDIDELHAYVEANSEQFEDFRAADH